MASRGDTRKRPRDWVNMKDRLWYLVHTCCQQGALVTATTAQGEKVTGKLHTVVRGAVKLQDVQESRSGTTSIEGFQSLSFAVEDSVEKGQKFKSDAEIVKARAPGRRELQKYSPDTAIVHTLEERPAAGKFDQFETNRKLFGVNATYDEGQYTTPLVRPDELTADQIRHTEQIIKAIERNEGLDDAGGEMEDEEKFAAVQGTGRFQDRPRAAEINTKVDRVVGEKAASPGDPMGYRKLRENLIHFKRLDGLTSIEALQLEVTAFHNEEVADGLEKFKRQKQREHSGASVKQNLQEFKEEFERKTSRKNSIIELPKSRKAVEPLDEIAEECPASLLDLYLDSLVEAEPSSPHWPEPEEAVPSAPSTSEQPSLNPDAPAFEFSLPGS